MNCQSIQEQNLLEKYHTGALAADSPVAHESVREHLETCEACRAQLAALVAVDAQIASLAAADEVAAPSGRMRARFAATLAAEKRLSKQVSHDGSRSSRVDAFLARLFPRRPAYQFACAVMLLAAGVFIGSRLVARAPVAGAVVATNYTQGQNSILAANDTDAMRRELTELRAQVNGMGRLVSYSLLQQKSTSERLQTVLATLDLKSPDRQLLTDLVATLALDPSVNVRLSAVDALAPHADEELVRAGLIAALLRENAPLVQVAMIEVLANTRDPDAAPVLTHLSTDERADPSVRETARRALAILNTPAVASPVNGTGWHGAAPDEAPAKSADNTLSHTPGPAIA